MSLDWNGARAPAREALAGEHVVVRPLDADRDGADLHESTHSPELWTYMPYGPFATRNALESHLRRCERSADPLFFAICPRPHERPCGVASYLRISPEHGTIEIGHILFGPGLQRTTAATEAVYLLAANAFDELGYRRLEWKCDALNHASRRAAERFGFRFEGIFRKHLVIKGRNRDTAWFAITDDEWPQVRAAIGEWLEPANFDEDGRQRLPLAIGRR